MQYSQEHLKTMVYAEFGGQTECIMGNWKIENETATMLVFLYGKIPFPLLRTIFQDANLVPESGARQLIG